MKRINFIIILLCLITFYSCSNDDSEDTTPTTTPINQDSLYFPPIDSANWEVISPNELGWNSNNIIELINFIDLKSTKAFIILKDGKIALEWYGNGEDINSNLQWNSAGKTLNSYMIGIAQDEGILNINEPSKNYLGNNWSTLTNMQEESITVKHHITMTTGLDFNVQDETCYDPNCLDYLNPPGSFWYYHNAPYTLTQNIVEGALNSSFNQYFNDKLRDKIGMQGTWISFGYFNIYYSNARSMARFGLLNLNKGVWETTPIIRSENYFNEMTNTSQTHNKSYGYLWWLNGKESFRAPGSTLEFPSLLIPNAPDDTIAALGRDDQKLYVIPSKNMVVVRLGDNTGTPVLGPSSFDNKLWEKINLVIN